MKALIRRQVQTPVTLVVRAPVTILHEQQALRRLKRKAVRWKPINWHRVLHLALRILAKALKQLWAVFFGAELVRKVGPGIPPQRSHEWDPKSTVNLYRYF